MQFWDFMEKGMGIFLTLAILGVILTHSEEFASMVQKSGQTITSLFRSMTFQG
jgi:hypothetical protein